MVSSTPRPCITPGKDTVPIVQEAGWAPGPVWKGGNSRPTGIRSQNKLEAVYFFETPENLKPHCIRYCLHSHLSTNSKSYVPERSLLAISVVEELKQFCPAVEAGNRDSAGNYRGVCDSSPSLSVSFMVIATPDTLGCKWPILLTRPATT